MATIQIFQLPPKASMLTTDVFPIETTAHQDFQITGQQLIDLAATQLLKKSNNLTDVANKTTSFNNLSPITTKGDLISSNGTDNIRVSVGSDTYILTADSTQSSGIRWAPNATGTFLQVANNLNDVASKPTSFNNISPTSIKGDIIVNNGTTNTSLSVGANTYVLTADSTQLSGIKWAPNATGSFLAIANNLSDVANKTVSFNNVSPITTKGDLISSDGTNNVRLALGTNGYILTADNTQSTGIKWSPAGGGSSGFVDNAIFVSTASTILTGGVNPTRINLNSLIAQSPGNSWTLSGDTFGMKCNAPGTYSFCATIPYNVSALSSFGVIFSNFTKNNANTGALTCINPIVGQGDGIYQATVYHIITCAQNDIIRLVGTCGATIAPVVFFMANISSGANVLITRLL